jgi:hypothetical protein
MAAAGLIDRSAIFTNPVDSPSAGFCISDAICAASSIQASVCIVKTPKISAQEPDLAADLYRNASLGDKNSRIDKIRTINFNADKPLAANV